MLSCKDLLAKIYEDEKVEDVLEALGCQSIHPEQGGSLIVASRPEGNNRRSVQVRNDETLKVKVRTTGFEGDLLDFVKEMYGFQYISDTQEYLQSICGYDKNTTYEPPALGWLNKIKRQRKCYDISFDLPILDECILEQYIYEDIKQFTDDGISTSTLLDYKIGYDVITKRITIPVRDIYGNLCGIKGRATTKEDEEMWKFYFLYKCDQSKTLFNYYRAKEYCTLEDEVLVFESEKSPLQMIEFGIFNAVGIGSSNISQHQMNLLYGLNCDITLCFDEGLEKIDDRFESFKIFFNGKRNVYAIVNSGGLLPKKASPSDCGVEIWNQLYKNKILICGGV